MKQIVINSPKHGIFNVLVDDEDYELVAKYKWRINKPNGKVQYALTNLKEDNYKPIKIHQMIMGRRDIIIDHKDGNGLNNQKSNLRFSNHSLNGFNRGLNKNNTTGHKGVIFIKSNKRKKPYYAGIKVNRKHISIGYFKTKEEASIAYNNAALKYIGDHLKPNTL